jgi:tRNA(fMet)-specific endonuclease VapC
VTHLVDSDWVADYLRGKSLAVDLLTSLGPTGLAISLITFGEIYEGVYYGRDPRRAEEIFLGFLRWIDILPLDEAILRRFARIRGDLRRRGQLVGDSDILIAATEIHFGLTLVKRNLRHFERIAELEIFEPPV